MKFGKTMKVCRQLPSVEKAAISLSNHQGSCAKDHGGLVLVNVAD